MIARDALVAGVLAATDQVVQQASAGNWQAALNSSNDRRLFLEQLSQQEPERGEHGFLRALREAAAESDVALGKMRVAAAPVPRGGGIGNQLCTKA